MATDISDHPENILKKNHEAILNQQRWIFWAVFAFVLSVIFLVLITALGQLQTTPPTGTSQFITLEKLNEALAEVKAGKGDVEEKIQNLEIQNLGERIGDIATSSQIVGIATGIFGVLLTVLVLYFQLNEKERVQTMVEQIVNPLIRRVEEASIKAESSSVKANEVSVKANEIIGSVNENITAIESELDRLICFAKNVNSDAYNKCTQGNNNSFKLFHLNQKDGACIHPQIPTSDGSIEGNTQQLLVKE